MSHTIQYLAHSKDLWLTKRKSLLMLRPQSIHRPPSTLHRRNETTMRNMSVPNDPLSTDGLIGDGSVDCPPSTVHRWTMGDGWLGTRLGGLSPRWTKMEWNTFHSKKIHRDFEQLYLGPDQTDYKNLKNMWKFNLFSLESYKIYIFMIRISSSMII